MLWNDGLVLCWAVNSTGLHSAKGFWPGPLGLARPEAPRAGFGGQDSHLAQMAFGRREPDSFFLFSPCWLSSLLFSPFLPVGGSGKSGGSDGQRQHGRVREVSTSYRGPILGLGYGGEGLAKGKRRWRRTVRAEPWRRWRSGHAPARVSGARASLGGGNQKGGEVGARGGRR